MCRSGVELADCKDSVVEEDLLASMHEVCSIGLVKIRCILSRAERKCNVTTPFRLLGPLLQPARRTSAVKYQSRYSHNL